MAKVKLNPTFEAIQGKVGELVYKRWEGEEIVSRMPDRTAIVATPNQLAQQERFRLAAVYGKAALADPESRELYEDMAGKRGIPVFAVTLSDFLTRRRRRDRPERLHRQGRRGHPGPGERRRRGQGRVRDHPRTRRGRLEEGAAVFTAGGGGVELHDQPRRAGWSARVDRSECDRSTCDTKAPRSSRAPNSTEGEPGRCRRGACPPPKHLELV